MTMTGLSLHRRRSWRWPNSRGDDDMKWSSPNLAAAAALLTLAAACGPSQPPPPPAQAAPPPGPPKMPALGIYVTNEQSGDLTVIDAATLKTVTTIPLGKRPRGIAANADGTRLYIALSGSPAAPPGVDEKTLPPPD